MKNLCEATVKGWITVKRLIANVYWTGFIVWNAVGRNLV